ncbi:MAG: NADPH-dependent FMN reductase [Bacteroidota bacterium]
MITLISGTNRKNSLTQQFSSIYFQMLKRKMPDSLFFDLCHLPDSLLNLDPDFYKNRPQELIAIQSEFFIPADKFIFIIPEYNGSYPGILKLLIDVLDPKESFKNKKAALTGIATGRAGNLRGMDHLTAVLNHMNVTVMPYQLPVSKVQHEFNGTDQFAEGTQNAVERQINDFIAF